jgi:hypothetical protein
MNGLIAATGIDLTGARWHSQASDKEDSGIPDLVADDAQRRHVLIVEAKFWAGLTENQPLGYLERQARQFRDSGDPRLLLFVAPSTRVEHLAQQLAQALESSTSTHGALRLIRAQAGNVAVTSWGDVLAALQNHFASMGDVEANDDLAQLWGLCDRADQFAQLPLSLDDLDPVHANIQLRYHDILDAVVARLSAEGTLNTVNLKSAGTKTWWGRNVREAQSGRTFLLTVSLQRWSHSYATPFWFSVYGRPTAELVTALESAIDDDTPFHEANDERFVVGLRTPLGVDTENIVSSLTATVTRLCAAIRAGSSAPSTESGPLDDAESML